MYEDSFLSENSVRAFELLKKTANRLSYKPGYSFFARIVDSEYAMVSLKCPSLPHSQDEDESVGLTINNTVRLSEISTDADAVSAFTSVVASLELHEAAEWFKVDGDQIFLPHGWGDDFGGFSWADFINLSGKFLSSFRNFLNKS